MNEEDAVKQYLDTSWKLLVIKGIVLVLFGLAAIFWPEITLPVMIIIFSVYVVAEGILNVIQGIAGIGKMQMWFLTVILGVLEVVAGIFAFKYTELTITYLAILIGAVFVVVGIIQIISSFDKGLTATMKMLIIIVGILSIVVGLAVVMYPAASGLAFVWLLGVYALITGPINIALGIDVRNVLKEDLGA